MVIHKSEFTRLLKNFETSLDKHLVLQLTFISDSQLLTVSDWNDQWQSFHSHFCIHWQLFITSSCREKKTGTNNLKHCAPLFISSNHNLSIVTDEDYHSQSTLNLSTYPVMLVLTRSQSPNYRCMWTWSYKFTFFLSLWQIHRKHPNTFTHTGSCVKLIFWKWVWEMYQQLLTKDIYFKEFTLTHKCHTCIAS